MTDIVERLANSSCNESSHELQCRCFDAAEEISRNRAAIDELVEALKNVLPEVAVCGLTSQLEMIRALITKHQSTTKE